MLLAALIFAQTPAPKHSDDHGVLTAVVDAFYNSTYRDLQHWRVGKYVVIDGQYDVKTRTTFSARIKEMIETWGADPSEIGLLKSFVSTGRHKISFSPEELLPIDKLGLDARVKIRENRKEEDPYSYNLWEGMPYKDSSGKSWTPRAILGLEPVTYSPQGKHAIAFVHAKRGYHGSSLRFLMTRSGTQWKIAMIQALHYV